jgi:bacterioferritin
MKGHDKVLELLNRVLRKELTGINQYFVHAKMCANWGYMALARHAREEALEEMKHADDVMERILFLDGTPNMAELDKMAIGKDVRQQMESDLALEQAALKVLVPGIGICNEVSDHATRELLEHIITDEEKHVDWIEAQLHQIREVGYELYLAQQIRSEHKD